MKKGLDLEASHANHAKYFPKKSISWPNFTTKTLKFKRYAQKCALSSATAHHDVKTFAVDGMV